MKIRVGQGYDVHQLKEGLPFWLGGIQIEHTHGALGHSDVGRKPRYNNAFIKLMMPLQ